MTKTVVHKDNLPYFGDEELLEIAPKSSFSDMIFEVLSGKKPNSHESKIFETILNISIDHGEDTPSAVETIKAGREGKTISESLSAGILQINEVHGGAIEPAMELLYRIKNEGLSVNKVVQEYMQNDKRIPGFGHRIYEVDPRGELLFKMAKEAKINQEFILMAREVETELTKEKNKPIPVNIDGSIATILCSFNWDSNLGKAVFLIARTPGLCAQFLNSTKK